MFLSTGDRGDDARIGDDERGEGMFGRWSNPNIGDATESMVGLVLGGGKSLWEAGMCVFLRGFGELGWWEV